VQDSARHIWNTAESAMQQQARIQWMAIEIDSSVVSVHISGTTEETHSVSLVAGFALSSALSRRTIFIGWHTQN